MSRTLEKTSALVFVVTAALLSSSCSFSDSFIIVNASGAALTVTYRVKPDPDAPHGLLNLPPEIKPVSQVSEEVAWQPLPSSRYKVDLDNRGMTLTLNADEALLLLRCRPADGGSTGDCESHDFDIAEIVLVGVHGEIKLGGEQAHTSFIQNKNTYTLTYH